MDPIRTRDKAPFTPRKVGRYLVHREIASGGMATVHIGRLLGQVGFSRTIAIKRMHEHCAKDPDFVSMFIDEARLAARIRHPNVVPTLDVVVLEGELFLVMEYVQGEALSRLVRRANKTKTRIPPRIAAAVMAGVLEGLHAAHEAVGEHGEPLGLVHRDVSPQNVIVGHDGIARVLDFGVAKAANRLQTTRDGQIKGKIEYMAPEQVRGSLVDRRTDIYAAAVILWELLTGRRLFAADNPVALWGKVLAGTSEPPSSIEPNVPGALDAVAMRGLEPDPTKRYQTGEDMAIALEQAIHVATPREVGRWVQDLAGKKLREREDMMAELDSVASTISLTPSDLSSEVSMRAGQPASPAPRSTSHAPAPSVLGPQPQSAKPAADRPQPARPSSGAPRPASVPRPTSSRVPRAPDVISSAPAKPAPAPRVPADLVEPIASPARSEHATAPVGIAQAAPAIPPPPADLTAPSPTIQQAGVVPSAPVATDPPPAVPSTSEPVAAAKPETGDEPAVAPEKPEPVAAAQPETEDAPAAAPGKPEPVAAAQPEAEDAAAVSSLFKEPEAVEQSEPDPGEPAQAAIEDEPVAASTSEPDDVYSPPDRAPFEQDAQAQSEAVIGDVVETEAALPLRSNYGFYAIAGVTTAGLLAAAAVLLSMGGGKNAEPRAELPIARSAVQLGTTATTPPTEAVSKAPKPEPPPAATKVTLTVVVSPKTATVEVGDRLVTGSSVVLDKSDVSVRVVTKAPGYKTDERSFTPEQDGRMVIELERAAVPGTGPGKVKIKGPMETEL